MKRIKCLVVSLCIFSTLTAPTYAWNKAGHMVSGAIAYQVLKKSNPDAVAKVVDLLESHPEFDSRWSRQLEEVDDHDRDLVLFMLAARWPDDIRGNDDYDRPTHHYINIPLKGTGAPDSIADVDSDDEDIVFAFRHNLEILTGDDDDDEKAVALCWLFHLMGDVHQPLHTAEFYGAKFKHGDNGGTKFFVKVGSDGDPLSLHKFWDGLVTGSENFRSVKNRATKIRHAFPVNELSELEGEFVAANFDKWMKDESFELAKNLAYRDGEDELKGGTKKSNAEELPDDYPKKAWKAATRRMALSGHRMAELLAKEIQ